MPVLGGRLAPRSEIVLVPEITKMIKIDLSRGNKEVFVEGKAVWEFAVINRHGIMS